MKKIFVSFSAAMMSALLSLNVLAADVTLYSLDKRELVVDESEVDLYTREGMGWFKEKPVDMYAEDGRTITVEAEKVEDYKNVGWYLSKEDFVSDKTYENKVQLPDESDTGSSNNETYKVTITLPGGPTISVPSYQLEMYKALGWVEGYGGKVTVYNTNGEEKEIDEDQLSRYLGAGWSVKSSYGTPSSGNTEKITVYLYDGSTKTIAKSSLDASKSEGWYPALDESIYAYAAFGAGDQPGATQLLENKQYELAFQKVDEAIKKLEGTSSEYVSMLYYLRTVVNDTWRADINSPIALINYNFQNNGDDRYIILEFRNISNSRIKSYKVDFNLCDASGNVFAQSDILYNVDNLDVKPCEAKKAAWAVSKSSILVKNVKVIEVTFSDGTVWGG